MSLQKSTKKGTRLVRRRRTKKSLIWYVCCRSATQEDCSSIVSSSVTFLLWDRLRLLNSVQRAAWDQHTPIPQVDDTGAALLPDIAPTMGDGQSEISHWYITDSATLLSGERDNDAWREACDVAQMLDLPVGVSRLPHLPASMGVLHHDRRPDCFKALFYKKTVPHENKMYPRSDPLNRCLARLISEVPYQAEPTPHVMRADTGPISRARLTTRVVRNSEGEMCRYVLVSHVVYRIGHWMLKYCPRFMEALKRVGEKKTTPHSESDPTPFSAVPSYIFNWFVTYYSMWIKHVGRRIERKEVITPVQSYLINDQFHYRDVGLMAVIMTDLDRDERGFMGGAAVLLSYAKVAIGDVLHKKLVVLVGTRMRILLQDAEGQRPQ